MADRYFSKILRRNWKGLSGAIILIIVVFLILKNIGEIPYENQYDMNTSLKVEFDYHGEQIKGFLFATYWVETDPNTIRGMDDNELRKYLSEHGQLYLDGIREEIIAELKTYPPKIIKENWYSNYEYFNARDVYYIDNDENLQEFLEEQDLRLDLPYEYKKVFFVYLSNKEEDEG